MDPCPFVRILVGNLAVKSPATSAPSFSGELHPSGSPYFCRIQLKDCDSHRRYHFAGVPVISFNAETYPHSVAACFDLSKPQIEKLLRASRNPVLKVSVYRRRRTTSCAFDNAKLLGKISVSLDLTMAESRSCMFQNGWIAIGAKNRGSSSSSAGNLMHLTVRAEPDPRFVFRFDGEPECSPQVFQIQGNVRQPVFTCKFGFRDRNVASRSCMLEPSNSKSWLPSSLNSQKDHSAERKGWSITVHDLSGSPVAAASMVTPFVPSPGSHRVCRSNPGAWLILRPGGDGTWKPWGRLEAWREHNSSTVGYRFQILPTVASPVTLASSAISSQHGGKFTVDVTSGVTPMNSPSGSWDLSSGSRSGSGSGSDFGLEQQMLYKGFVMSATVDGEGKCSQPEVEVGVQHVTCTEDAAAFVALAAAMDLSMDACKLFSQKLRKELRQ